jgi:hypothetical protein
MAHISAFVAGQRLSFLDSGMECSIGILAVSFHGYNELFEALYDNGKTKLLRKVFHKWSAKGVFKGVEWIRHPCGGGFEYLHRDPASRRRRRKRKSQFETEIRVYGLEYQGTGT